MDLKTLIRTRRTVRRFTDTIIPVETITDILETALWVPNHKLTQPWRFILVTKETMPRLIDAATAAIGARTDDEEKIKQRIDKTERKLSRTPAVVLFVMKENDNPVVRDEDYASVSCLIHNFGLLAWERGLGTVWETYGFIRQPEFKTAMGLASDEIIVGSVHIGEPEAVPEAKKRKPLADLLTLL